MPDTGLMDVYVVLMHTHEDQEYQGTHIDGVWTTLEAAMDSFTTGGPEFWEADEESPGHRWTAGYGEEGTLVEIVRREVKTA